MKLCSGSGGGVRGIGQIAVVEKAKKLGYKFDAHVGVSVYALLQVPLVLNKFEKLKKVYLVDNLHDKMWKYAPVKKNGKFSPVALYVLLKEKIAIGDMSGVRDMLKDLVSPIEFKYYKHSDLPPCYALAVDFVTGKNHLINLKELSYDDYLDWCMASSAIPVFNLPIKKSGMILYDGGVRNHIATVPMMKKFNITESLNIFTRPEDFKLVNQEWSPTNPIDIIARLGDIRNIEISKKDEGDIKELTRNNRDKHKIIFMPSILKNTYDTDLNRLKELYKESYKILK